MNVDLKELHRENERAWDIVARAKYAGDVEGDVALLKAVSGEGGRRKTEVSKQTRLLPLAVL